MDPLHATIEEFAAEGYTHVEAHCPRCRVIRLQSINQRPEVSMGLTLCAALSAAAADVGEAVAADRCERKDVGG